MMSGFVGPEPARINVAEYDTPREINFDARLNYEVSEPWIDFGVLRMGWEKIDDSLMKLKIVTLNPERPYALDLRWLEWAFTVRDIEYGEEKLRTAFVTARIVKAEFGMHGDPIPWSLTLQTSNKKKESTT